MRAPRTSLLVLTLFVSTCAGPRPDARSSLTRRDGEHDARLAAFSAEQSSLRRRTRLPQRQVFPGLGTLVLNEIGLVGRPGKAWVRAGFTFVNSERAGFDVARVELRLRDPRSGEWWGEWIEMRTSFGLRPGPESSYTSWIDTPTRDVETVDGWEWEIVLEPAQG